MKNLLLIIILCLHYQAQTSHLIGGEITARRIDNASLAYEITVTGYTDDDSAIFFGGGTLRFGDESVLSGPFTTTSEQLPGGIRRFSFKVTHTFKGSSAAGYRISYQEDFRNGGIININNGNSIQTPFYVETLLVIDPFIGANNTPVFLAPPIDWGQAGSPLITNPAAYDPDGDLLTYRLVDVKRAMNTPVLGYQSPNDPSFYTEYNFGNGDGDGPPTFSIDRFNGNLIWDAPGDVTNDSFNECENGATYNIAIAVDEWRLVRGTWKKLGYITRDYIVNLCTGDNVIPVIDTIADTCVVAETSFSRQITSGSGEVAVNLAAFGELFELANEATQTFHDGSLSINWEPKCSETRRIPYRIHVRSLNSEISGPVLTSYDSWDLYVRGPEVTGLSIQDQQDGSAVLSWDAYTCPNADSIEIWRKEGSYEGNTCDLVDPATQEFTLAGKVPADQKTFIDSQLPTGTNSTDFSWHLSATFPGDRQDNEELISILTGAKPTQIGEVNIFPNPTDGTVFIKGSNTEMLYRILNLSGQLLIEGEIKSGRIDNLNDLKEGIYVLNLVDHKRKLVYGTRLFIQK